MSSKKLTRKEFDRITDLANLDPYSFKFCQLVSHIEAVGVFAAEEPTDEEINATIAKAQGWKGHRAVAGVVTDWVNRVPNSGGIIKDYSPVSNLGQAVDATTALGERLELGSRGGKYRIFLGKVWPKEVWCDTAADAARAISLHLYRRIKDGES